jgi:hypothetical protein
MKTFNNALTNPPRRPVLISKRRREKILTASVVNQRRPPVLGAVSTLTETLQSVRAGEDVRLDNIPTTLLNLAGEECPTINPWLLDEQSSSGSSSASEKKVVAKKRVRNLAARKGRRALKILQENLDGAKGTTL